MPKLRCLFCRDSDHWCENDCDGSSVFICCCCNSKGIPYTTTETNLSRWDRARRAFYKLDETEKSDFVDWILENA